MKYGLVLLILIVSLFAPVRASANNYIVSALDGTNLREDPDTSAASIMYLPHGTYIEHVDWFNSYQQVRVMYPGKTTEGFVWHLHASPTSNSTPSSSNIQLRLKNLGYAITIVDGKVGPQTRKAAGDYMRDSGLPPGTPMTLAFYNHLLLTTYAREEPARLAKKHRTELLAQTSGAQIAFDKGDCRSFMTFPPEARRRRTLADCEIAHRQSIQQIRFDSALSSQDCTLARSLAPTLAKDETQRVIACEAAVNRAANLAEMEMAMAALDCAAVARIAPKLNDPEASTQCRLNSALAAPTAREVFLAAGLFDAEGLKPQATILYSTVVERFPQDDLALQAVTRLTMLRDQQEAASRADSQQQQIDSLRRQAEAAEKEAAAVKAQIARASSRPPKVQASPRNTACDGIVPGMYFRLTQRQYKTARDVASTILYGAVMGNNFHVTGVDAHNGVAWAFSPDSGKTLKFSCSKIPR